MNYIYIIYRQLSLYTTLHFEIIAQYYCQPFIKRNAKCRFRLMP